VSSVSNVLYFLTLPLVSVTRIIYTSKGTSKKFGVRVIYRKVRYFKACIVILKVCLDSASSCILRQAGAYSVTFIKVQNEKCCSGARDKILVRLYISSKQNDKFKVTFSLGAKQGADKEK
jgi:CMP-N-acetylneuraminic acid synthetase